MRRSGDDRKRRSILCAVDSREDDGRTIWPAGSVLFLADYPESVGERTALISEASDPRLGCNAEDGIGIRDSGAKVYRQCWLVG